MDFCDAPLSLINRNERAVNELSIDQLPSNSQISTTVLSTGSQLKVKVSPDILCFCEAYRRTEEFHVLHKKV